MTLNLHQTPLAKLVQDDENLPTSSEGEPAGEPTYSDEEELQVGPDDGECADEEGQEECSCLVKIHRGIDDR